MLSHMRWLGSAALAGAVVVAAFTGPAMSASKDIVDTAADAGKFKTLITAVQAAGLESTLRGPGPYTVFAPTDEAFAQLPDGTYESLLEPANKDKLVKVLTFHVVPGKVPSSAVKPQPTKLATVEGSELDIVQIIDEIYVDYGSQVIKADVPATNGVIHVIDKVMLPPDM